MRIIISPAKKMNHQPDLLETTGRPYFMQEAQELLGYLQGRNPEECKKIWNCNDKIAETNYRRLQELNLTQGLTPAILSYEGIQYQYMAPSVMEKESLDYLQEHLRILSGFYGILKPFDGIVPYRLEMQAKGIPHNSNLYEYWGDKIAKLLMSELSVRSSDKEVAAIINLASKEYSRCICKYLTNPMITCVFGERINGKIVEKGTFAKMARGEMVKYLAEKKVRNPEDMRGFQGLGYKYSVTDSSADTYVFLKEVTKDDTWSPDER